MGDMGVRMGRSSARVTMSILQLGQEERMRRMVSKGVVLACLVLGGMK